MTEYSNKKLVGRRREEQPVTHSCDALINIKVTYETRTEAQKAQQHQKPFLQQTYLHLSTYTMFRQYN